ncbi:NAD(P)/FAD-dependent oxidoreductase [Niabella sp.]|uniref:phytoene desaturase family protein n=1 Tax=Niabella sp. TaxID=1962976 RepID=UPI0026247B2E|nr:NAD(P)/FAD-dependent oxidoreductase [Niabella sp.]
MDNVHSLQFDVIIIGSGVGGLTAAAILSKSGLKVAVLEKEPRTGGYLAGFQRKGFRFDTAIHWLNQCSATGSVSKIFDFIGKDHPSFKCLEKIQRYKSESIDFLLTNNPDELKALLIKTYPEDQQGITRFFQKAKKIGASFNNFKSVMLSAETMNAWARIKNIWNRLRFALPFIPFITYSGTRMKKGLKKFFSNEKIHDIFSAETDLLSCLVPIGWAYYNDYQTPPAGGGQVVPHWLAHVVKQYGNKLFLNTTVKKIVTENGAVKGVEALSKGKALVLHADYVIAACDLETVYCKLLPEGAVSKKMISRLNAAEIYASSFTLSIALNCSAASLGFGEEMIHLFKDGLNKDLHNSGDPDFSALSILAPSHKDDSLAPEGKGSLVVFMPAYMHQYNHWNTCKDMERGEAYTALKTQIAEKLIKRLALVYPGIEAHILFYEAATPVTHWRYTGNKNGTMMGTRPNKKNMQSKVARYKTPVKNLLIGGHWAELGGGVPIAVKAGTNAALIVLKERMPATCRKLMAYLNAKITLDEARLAPEFKPYAENWSLRLKRAP